MKPSEKGAFSSKVYHQGDYKLFRYKYLSGLNHTQPMGEGTPSYSTKTTEAEWRYPTPESVDEYILNRVCNR